MEENSIKAKCSLWTSSASKFQNIKIYRLSSINYQKDEKIFIFLNSRYSLSKYPMQNYTQLPYSHLKMIKISRIPDDQRNKIKENKETKLSSQKIKNKK